VRNRDIKRQTRGEERRGENNAEDQTEMQKGKGKTGEDVDTRKEGRNEM